MSSRRYCESSRKWWEGSKTLQTGSVAWLATSRKVRNAGLRHLLKVRAAASKEIGAA